MEGKSELDGLKFTSIKHLEEKRLGSKNGAILVPTWAQSNPGWFEHVD
jgi:hypothetical protein